MSPNHPPGVISDGTSAIPQKRYTFRPKSLLQRNRQLRNLLFTKYDDFSSRIFVFKFLVNLHTENGMIYQHFADFSITTPVFIKRSFALGLQSLKRTTYKF